MNLAPVYCECDRLFEKPAARGKTLDQSHELERFLKEAERRGFRMAEVATGNSEEALDILQDAMFKLVEKYADRPKEEWGPLFTRILQSRIRDWYRRSKVRNRFRVWLGFREDDENGVDAIQSAEDLYAKRPEEELAQENSMIVLEQAVRALPIRQQQAFMLRTFEGLDVAATASAMDCSEGSVKTHYSRAVHKLREQLGEHWP